MCGIDDSGEGEYDPSAIVSLVRVLNENKTLRTLKIAENDLGDVGAGLFADALNTRCILNALDISSNNLFQELEASMHEAESNAGHIRRIAIMVKGSVPENTNASEVLDIPSKNLTNIGETTNDGSDSDVDERAVANAAIVKVVDNRLKGIGGKKFITALSQCNLMHLDLGFNDIGPSAATLLAQSLANNVTVTYLELKGNPLLCAGVSAIADMMKHNRTLRILGLEKTGIRASGVSKLADSLVNYESLRKLNISLNDFGDEGAAKLSVCLKKNCYIKYLYLHRCNMGCDGIAYISSVLQVNHTIKHIGLSCNDIGEIGIMALAASMLLNTTLVSLDISETKLRRNLGRVGAIGLEGWSALASMIRSNSTLNVLNILGYNIPNESLEEILDAMNIRRICLVKADFRTLKWKYDEALQAIDAERNLLSSKSIPNSVRLHVCGDSAIGKTTALYGWLKLQNPPFFGNSDFLGLGFFSAPVSH